MESKENLTRKDSDYVSGFESDIIETNNGNDIVITFIKHASLMLSYGDYHIQVDPVSMFADYSRFPKADVILITHQHHDHFDIKAISDLEKDNTLIITNQSTGDILKKGKIVQVGEKLAITDFFTLEIVPAYSISWPARYLAHPKGRDIGFILTIDGTRIYIAGDTSYIPEMYNLKNIDIAFLPVRDIVTMSVKQAEKAARAISPKILYPYHYKGTEISKLAESLKDSGIDVRIRDMYRQSNNS